MLRIAIPNKGALSEGAMTLVREAGYSCKRYGKELAVWDAANEVEFIFLRPRDIAIYVQNQTLELGITGRDLAQDSGADVEELLELNFGRSTFRYAVPVDSELTPDTLGGTRIATSYPLLVRKDLKARGLEATVVKLDGAVEISVQLGVADAIADVVESGRTLKEAGLKTVGDSLLKSEAVIIAGDASTLENEAAKIFIERCRGIILARRYAIVEYDCPATALDEACDITPGIEAPTISPLREDGWFAVKAMAKRKDVNSIMDQLSAIGARGIIISYVQTCRY